jgi:hypothetical protein
MLSRYNLFFVFIILKLFIRRKIDIRLDVVYMLFVRAFFSFVCECVFMFSFQMYLFISGEELFNTNIKKRKNEKEGIKTHAYHLNTHKIIK